jgi:hypothetical protein
MIYSGCACNSGETPIPVVVVVANDLGGVRESIPLRLLLYQIRKQQAMQGQADYHPGLTLRNQSRQKLQLSRNGRQTHPLQDPRHQHRSKLLNGKPEALNVK